MQRQEHFGLVQSYPRLRDEILSPKPRSWGFCSVVTFLPRVFQGFVFESQSNQSANQSINQNEREWKNFKSTGFLLKRLSIPVSIITEKMKHKKVMIRDFKETL